MGESAGSQRGYRLTGSGGVESAHLAQVRVVVDCMPVSAFGSSCKVTNRVGLGRIRPSQQVLATSFVIAIEKEARGGPRDGGERTLRAEELARDVEGLAAGDDDLLATQELLGDDGGQAAEEVALAIDDDLQR